MRLRVIDFGLVPALRSQAVYHGLAETIGPDSAPILSLASPETPYVCIGMHQDLAKEVDEAFCAANGFPVWRRQVGGGAVYLDRNQLFTHFIYPQRHTHHRLAGGRRDGVLPDGRATLPGDRRDRHRDCRHLGAEPGPSAGNDR